MSALTAALQSDNEQLRRDNALMRKALADIRALCMLDTALRPEIVLPLIPTTRRSAE